MIGRTRGHPTSQPSVIENRDYWTRCSAGWMLDGRECGWKKSSSRVRCRRVRWARESIVYRYEPVERGERVSTPATATGVRYKKPSKGGPWTVDDGGFSYRYCNYEYSYQAPQHQTERRSSCLRRSDVPRLESDFGWNNHHPSPYS
jgi:hypothetical protein